MSNELLAGVGSQQISYLEVHEQVGRRAGGSGSNIGRHKVSRNVAGRNSSEDQLSDFSHGSGGCDVGFPCNPAYDKRQKEGDENGETAHPVGNVKGSVGQVAERDEGDDLPGQEPAHGRFYFFHIRQMALFVHGEHGSQGREGACNAFPLEEEGHDAGYDHACGASPQRPSNAVAVAGSSGKKALAGKPGNVQSPADGAPNEKAEGGFHAHQCACPHKHEVPFEENGSLVPVSQDMLLDGSQPFFPAQGHGDGIGGGEQRGVKQGLGLSGRLFPFRIENFERFRRGDAVREFDLLDVDHLAFHWNGHRDAQYGDKEYPGKSDSQGHVLSGEQEKGGYGPM